MLVAARGTIVVPGTPKAGAEYPVKTIGAKDITGLDAIGCNSLVKR